MLITKEIMIEYIKDDLSAGIVNLDLSDAIIERNLNRAVALSSDFFNYTTFKTIDITKTTASGGYIPLSEIDPDGTPVIVAVFPTTNVLNIDGALLGLGSIFINADQSLNNQLTSYATMLFKLSQIESVLGRNARVVGDKLYVDKYYTTLTVEYIPQVVKIENINEGAWIRFLVDYTCALCKKQMAQARGKYVVSSNPASTNAETLLSDANETIIRLEEELKQKGVLLARR